MKMSQEMKQCTDSCLKCARVCLESVAHCIEKGGNHAEASHIKALFECAKICQTSGELMLLDAESSGRLCGLCAEVCNRCAESCEQFADDEQMKACAEICRECASTCQSMAA